MEQQKSINKFNIFDGFIVSLLTVFLFFVVISFTNHRYLEKDSLNITVKITDAETINNINGKIKIGQNVYINGINYPVTTKSFLKSFNKDGSQTMLIVFNGFGKHSDDRTIFLGQRILINQKIEIHGNYIAQGYLTKIEYAN